MWYLLGCLGIFIASISHAVPVPMKLPTVQIQVVRSNQKPSAKVVNDKPLPHSVRAIEAGEYVDLTRGCRLLSERPDANDLKPCRIRY
jgi:hypothetical protein